ncbi:VOC family protein [Brevibacterium sp. 2SA]|uniref:VOC family protein n=1 Tax=Brevibacterium sp. 2SA TaxID=2502198 RepID=UPI0010F4A3C2|nr:VOC family protein [Brevibacterium sp. 2SA]
MTTTPDTTGDTSAATASARTPREANIWPAFRYRDAKAAIAFLTEAFGFEVAVEYTNPEDPTVIEHAELVWPGGGGIMLGSARDDDGPMAKGGVAYGSVYIATDDVDALHQRALDAGAVEVAGLHDLDYGSRDFSVTDPEGVLWNFGTYRGHDR